MAKKEVVDSRLDVLKKVILTKLSSLKNKKFEDKLIDEFGLAFRVFLLRYLNLNYEFTEEELSIELEKKNIRKEMKERIMQIIDLVEEIKYKGKKITRHEFERILNEGVQLIRLIAYTQEKKTEVKLVDEKKPSRFLLLLRKILKKKEPTQKIIPAAKERKEEIGEIVEEAQKITKIGEEATPALREEKKEEKPSLGKIFAEKEKEEELKKKIEYEKKKIIEERLKRELEERDLEKKILQEKKKREAELIKEKKELLKKIKQETKEKLKLIKEERSKEIRKIKEEEKTRRQLEKFIQKEKIKAISAGLFRDLGLTKKQKAKRLAKEIKQKEAEALKRQEEILRARIEQDMEREREILNPRNISKKSNRKEANDKKA